MPSLQADSGFPIIELFFYGDLLDFFKDRNRSPHHVRYPLQRRASIKDIIESLGIPHTEVARIALTDRDLDFSFVPAGGEHLDIEPQPAQAPTTRPSVLRPAPPDPIRFLADNTVGKLARILRMAGLDTKTVIGDLPLETVAALAVREGRILLTRNKDLLKRRVVTYGRLVRHQHPEQQFQEISRLYHLVPLYRPFSRCMVCNTILETVDKELIIDRLEPLTRRYYRSFKQCRDCGRVYWQGSHHQRMSRRHGWSET